VNAIVALSRAATPVSKTAKALLLAELNDAEAGDHRLQDRAGYHPARALAIRETRFDRARLIDGVKRGPLWPSLRTDEAREHWYSAPAFNAVISHAPEDNPVWRDDCLIDYLREVPLTLELYSPREGRYHRNCWGAWSRDSWLGIYPTLADGRVAVLRHRRDAGERWVAEHRDRVLVDPDASAEPPIGRHYARWSARGKSKGPESLSAFERFVRADRGAAESQAGRRARVRRVLQGDRVRARALTATGAHRGHEGGWEVG
jgi:hypothetical protein